MQHGINDNCKGTSSFHIKNVSSGSWCFIQWIMGLTSYLYDVSFNVSLEFHLSSSVSQSQSIQYFREALNHPLIYTCFSYLNMCNQLISLCFQCLNVTRKSKQERVTANFMTNHICCQWGLYQNASNFTSRSTYLSSLFTSLCLLISINQLIFFQVNI